MAKHSAVLFFVQVVYRQYQSINVHFLDFAFGVCNMHLQMFLRHSLGLLRCRFSKKKLVIGLFLLFCFHAVIVDFVCSCAGVSACVEIVLSSLTNLIVGLLGVASKLALLGRRSDMQSLRRNEVSPQIVSVYIRTEWPTASGQANPFESRL